MILWACMTLVMSALLVRAGDEDEDPHAPDLPTVRTDRVLACLLIGAAATAPFAWAIMRAVRFTAPGLRS